MRLLRAPETQRPDPHGVLALAAGRAHLLLPLAALTGRALLIGRSFPLQPQGGAPTSTPLPGSEPPTAHSKGLGSPPGSSSRSSAATSPSPPPNKPSQHGIQGSFPSLHTRSLRVRGGNTRGKLGANAAMHSAQSWKLPCGPAKHFRRSLGRTEDGQDIESGEAQAEELRLVVSTG